MLAPRRPAAAIAQDLLAGADPRHRFAVSVVTETRLARAVHPQPADPRRRRAGSEIARSPSSTCRASRADPARHGTRTETVIALDMSRNIVLIAGTAYAGEIKKSVFSLFNFHAPARGVLPMHCSANIGADGDAALFFGLSRHRQDDALAPIRPAPLIGDDEHGWSDDGVFNLEGGCYAKTANLSASAEPEIFAATRRFGTVLENVVLDGDRRARLRRPVADREHPRRLSARGAARALPAGGVGRHAENRGVPHRRRLRRAAADRPADARAGGLPLPFGLHRQGGRHRARRHRAAGDLLGLLRRAVHAAPPTVYGDMLAAQAAQTAAPACWLINTGWTGGAYGVGKRIDIAATRRLVTRRYRRTGRARDADRPELRLRGADRAVPASPQRCSIRAPPGPTAPPTMPRRAAWSISSRRTLRSSPCRRRRSSANLLHAAPPMSFPRRRESPRSGEPDQLPRASL